MKTESIHDPAAGQPRWLGTPRRSTHKRGFVAAFLAVLGMASIAQAGFVNQGFEEPRITLGTPDFQAISENLVPGWKTTASDDQIEFWTDGFADPARPGTPSILPFQGAQFVELNANSIGALFQDALGIPASAAVNFKFAHRGRLGVDNLRVTITDLGPNGVPGSGDDTVIFTKAYATGNSAWAVYSSFTESPIFALGNPVRFQFESLNPGGAGNFLDDCDFGTTVVSPPPTLSSVSPSTSSTAGGTFVTLTGTSFTGATNVTFGGTAATNRMVVNSTTITCTTPARAAGTASVVVTTPAGTNAANTLFTYLAQAGFVNRGFEEPRFTPGVASVHFPTETSVPGWKTTASDDVIEFWTDGFGDTFGGGLASVLAHEGAQFVELNATQIGALFQDALGIPAGVAVNFRFAHRGRLGVENLRVTITDLGPNGVLGSGDDTVLFTKDYATGKSAWAVYSSFTEPIILARGNPVRFQFGSLDAGGAGNFLDDCDFGTNVVSPPPTLSSVSSSTGSTAGGTFVTLTGTSFTGATNVTFGGTVASNWTVVNSTTITCNTPARAAGTASVVVTTPAGTNAANTLFTYVAPPTLTSVSPNSGSTAGGTSVTLTGTNFTGATAVTFGGTAATNFSVSSATTITCTTPAGTAGAKSVLVTTPGGTNAANTLFTYVAPASAGLILNINTSNQTYSLSGSDTGSFELSGAEFLASWRLTGLGGGGPSQSLREDNMWSSSTGTPTGGGLKSLSIQVDNQAGGLVWLILRNSGVGPTTVTGLGVSASYASLSAANKAIFESANGMSLPLLSGSGFGAINPVPAPSSSLFTAAYTGSNPTLNQGVLYNFPIVSNSQAAPATLTITSTSAGTVLIGNNADAGNNINTGFRTNINLTLKPDESVVEQTISLTTGQFDDGLRLDYNGQTILDFDFSNFNVPAVNSMFGGGWTPWSNEGLPAMELDAGGLRLMVTAVTNGTGGAEGVLAGQRINVLNYFTSDAYVRNPANPNFVSGVQIGLYNRNDRGPWAISNATMTATARVIKTNSPPTVTSVSPNTGSTAGGTTVTITGNGFTGATNVTIGGIAVTNWTVVNATTITGTIPARTAGTASVLVTTPGGTNAANTLLTYDSTLLHRWTFNQAPGSATDGMGFPDDIGGANGLVKGQGARFTGSGLRIPGGLSSSSAAYGDLPNGLISGRTEVTLEGWVSVDGSQASFSRLFDFGSSAGQELTGAGPGGGNGTNYLFLSAQVGSGAGQQRLSIGANIATECKFDVNSATTSGQIFHYAVTIAPGGAGGSVLNYWKDGVRLVTNQNCPQLLSSLTDVNNWLGRSNYSVDGRLNGTLEEFRIHKRALSPTEVLASRAAGPVPSSVVPQQPTGLASVNTGTTQRINASWFSDARNGFVGTSGGVIRVTSDGGLTWTVQTTGIVTSINAVSQVGSDRFLAGANGVICISRNNGPWTVMPTTGLSSVTFTGLSFSSATRGFAVGTGGTICIYNGTTWVAQTTGITTAFNGVSVVPSTNTAWAVGAGGVICFYNGTAWSQVSSGVLIDFYSVSFLRSNLGFAVGANGLLCRYNGTTWQQVVTGTTVALRSVVSVDENTIIISGDGGLVCQSTNGGLTWAFLAAGSSSGDLATVATAEGQVYVFGDNGSGVEYSAPRQPSGVVPWTTGTTARIDACSFGSGIGFSGLIATAGGGIRTTSDGGKTFTASVTGITTEIRGVSQVGLDAFFVGANGVICVSRNNGPWTRMFTGSTEIFTGASFSSPTRGFAVGTRGTICFYNGTSWVSQTTGTTADFSAVSVVPNTNTAWAVGAGGVICFYNGSAWTVVNSGTTANFNSVSFLRSNLGFAVGDGGLVCRYNGSSWQPIVTGASVSIRNVAIANENTIVISGDGGLLCQSTDGGLTWTNLSVNFSGDLPALAVTEKGVVVFGAGGAGFEFPVPRLPIGLTGLTTGTSGTINAARFRDSRNGFFATDGGGIRTTTDGGLTWTVQSTAITTAINAVDQVGSDRYFAGANGVICISRNNGPWTAMPTATTEIFTGTSFSSPTRGFAVGTGGTICIYNGTNWVTQATGITSAFNGVSVEGNTTNAWAVGSGGVICRYNGTTWSQVSSGTTANFYGVSFLRSNLGYAVGANGLLCRYNGTVWQPVPTGITVALRSVVIVDENTLLISGDGGLVCQSTDGGLTWVNLSIGSSARVATIVQAEGQIYAFGSGGAGIEFSVPRLPGDLTTLTTGTTASINSSSFGATGTGLIATNGGGIRRTSDGGETWTDSATGITGNIFAVRQVGSDAFFAGANGVICRSVNNGAWSSQTTGTTATFSGLSFSSATRGFAVGTGGTICIYNGTSWVAQTTGTTEAFYGVSVVPSTNNAWAVGSGGIICRYNGTAWIQSTSGVNNADFYGVSFLRDNLGFAVGANGLLCRYDGTSWQQVSTGASVALRSVVILDEKTILVSGDEGLVCQSTDGGFTWEYLSVNATARLTTLAASDGEVYAFGADGVGRVFISPLLVFVSKLTTGTPAQINAASFGSSQNLFVATNGGGIRVTSDGGLTWTTQNTGIASSINATSQVGSDRYFAGANGVICRSLNNGSWTAQTTNAASVTFTGLSFSSSTRGFAVGSGGTICIYNGTSWVAQATGITSAFNAVSAVGNTTAWAVGAGGVICRYNGTSWSQVSSGTTADFYSVSFAGENEGYAVGANGLICRYNGTSWIPSISGVTTDLRSVQISGTEVIVCGDRGLVLSSINAGVSWEIVSVGTSMDLFATFYSGGGYYAFGASGTGVRYNYNASDTYASWIATFPSVTPGLAGFNQDADGDGVGNGTENFLGTNPGGGSAGLIASVKSGNTFTFTHPQNAFPAFGVSGVYRWSKDLVTFRNGGQSDGVTTVSFNAITTAGITTVTATVTGTPATRLFVDVKVSQN